MAMIKQRLFFTLICMLAFSALHQPVLAQTPISDLFGQLGLTPQQIASISHGRPVAKVLSWGPPSEIYVFGAVYIDGTPSVYLKLLRDVGRLARTPGYLAVGEL